MKLESNNELLAENKVLILYILTKLNRDITNDNLLNLILSVREMNYFYFKQFITDLEANNYVIEYEKNEETVYEITQKGKETLQLTDDLLPGIIKLKVDNIFKEKLREIENESSVVAEFIPNSETDFIVKCSIVEHNSAVFQVQISASSREQAKLICENWKTHYETIYPTILNMFTQQMQ